MREDELFANSGRNIELHKDLGYDEIREDWYGLYILDEQGNIFCQVFGETIEICDDKADKILELNYIV